MTDKHTPGPWEAKPKVSDHKRFVIWSNKEAGAAVCETSNWLNEDFDEIKANAYLIAAAPDLFEALDRFVGWHLLDIEPSQLLREAQQALAKARGDQP